jgi:DNA-sulfur modification-associated
MTPNVIPELVNILPEGVSLETTDSLDRLHERLGKETLNGNVRVFFGTLMIQGNRPQFVGATSMKTLTDMALIDRSKKRATADEVAEHTNRPGIPAHQKALRDYLLNTACMREKFVLPNFMLNFGVKAKEERENANTEATISLIIYRPTATTGINVWPAILIVGINTKLDVTDGAHRDAVIEGLIADSRVSDDARAALLENAVGFTIIMEADRASSHQDFADCGKAKAIQQSLVITFDIRDAKNNRALQLVNGVGFLRHFVDATANNINLSARSSKVWSMSAMRMVISQIVDHYHDADAKPPEGTDAVKWRQSEIRRHTDGLEAFIRACVQHLPVLAELNTAMRAEEPTVTVGELRESLGGDVLLRGIGMAILARAFVHCQEAGIDYDTMAKKLAGVDWHVLTVERSTLDAAKAQSGADYAKAVVAAGQPLWSHMITVSEAGYRIRSTSQAADEAWKRILKTIALAEIAEAA